MFNVEHYLLLLSVVTYEGMDGVTVGHPADETRVGGERDDRVALNAARIKEGRRKRGGGGAGVLKEEQKTEGGKRDGRRGNENKKGNSM